MAKIFTVSYVPDHLLHDWLQHLRDFDTKHPQCHFEVKAEASDMSIAAAEAVVRVSPPLDFTAVLKK